MRFPFAPSASPTARASASPRTRQIRPTNPAPASPDRAPSATSTRDADAGAARTADARSRDDAPRRLALDERLATTGLGASLHSTGTLSPRTSKVRHASATGLPSPARAADGLLAESGPPNVPTTRSFSVGDSASPRARPLVPSPPMHARSSRSSLSGSAPPLPVSPLRAARATRPSLAAPSRESPTRSSRSSDTSPPPPSTSPARSPSTRDASPRKRSQRLSQEMSHDSAHSQRVARVSAEYAAAVLAHADSRADSRSHSGDWLSSSDPTRSDAHRMPRVRNGSVARAANAPRAGVATAVERNSTDGARSGRDADGSDATGAEPFAGDMFILPLSELPWVKEDPVRAPMFQPIVGGKLSFAHMWTQAVSNWHGRNRTSSRRANRAADLRTLGEERSRSQS